MLQAFKGIEPVIGKRCLIFENSTIIGKVEIGDDVSIWPYVSLRGDFGKIIIGDRSNIQESSILHCQLDGITKVGSDTTVGHNAVIHNATVGNNCLIGIGSIVLDDAVVEDGAIVAAGCVVPPRAVVPKNHLVAGNPMKVIKELAPEKRAIFDENTKAYLTMKNMYMEDE